LLITAESSALKVVNPSLWLRRHQEPLDNR
jgi:hypothetical protein